MTISRSIAYATVPIFAIALITGLLMIPSVGDVLASLSGSDKGQNAAPTLGLDFKGQRIIDNGLKINAHTYTVEGFSQTIPTQTFNVNQTIDVTLHFHLPGGPSHLAHTSLLLVNGEKSEQIRWNQNFKGMQTVYVSDPAFLKNAVVTLSDDKNNPYGAFLNFKFQVPEYTPTSTLAITAWSQEQHSMTNYFYNAINVGEPEKIITITTADGKFIAPLKQTKNGVMENNVKCNSEKELMFKKSGAPVCVKPESVSKFLAIGWTQK